ncbi:nucleotide-binding protein [Priestia megaterium]|uniref:nucleotide-binding protein n=1 Tax=Priestia megaterium TaxID=1404 RepID=UPI003008D7A0
MSKIFIGSSSESIYLANALFANLDNTGKVEVTPWYNGVFEVGNYTMEDLITQLDSNDFEVFILDADDISISRGIAQSSARDNVIFELGLFMGRLGRERVFFITPKELPEGTNSLEILVPVDESDKDPQKNYEVKNGKTFEKKIVNSFKVPSDLYGIAPLQYRLRTDGNWKAALTDVSSQLSSKFARLGRKENPQDKLNQLTEQILQLTEELEKLVAAYDELERQHLFMNQAKEMPIFLDDEHYDRLLMALDSGIHKGAFNLKGITLFKLEEQEKKMVQCGKFKDVGEHGKWFPLEYNRLQDGQVNVIEAYNSGEVTTVKKKSGREYLISVPFFKKYVVKFHYYHTIKVKDAVKELNDLVRDEDPVFVMLEDFFGKSLANTPI